jgi:hypothetical protein
MEACCERRLLPADSILFTHRGLCQGKKRSSISRSEAGSVDILRITPDYLLPQGRLTIAQRIRVRVRTLLSPRWGLTHFSFPNYAPRLTPWAAFFRRFAAWNGLCIPLFRMRSSYDTDSYSIPVFFSASDSRQRTGGLFSKVRPAPHYLPTI